MKFIFNSELRYLLYAVISLLCIFIGFTAIQHMSLVQILIAVSVILMVTVVIFSKTAFAYVRKSKS